MPTRILLLSALLMQVSGCVMSPRFEVSESIDFSAPPPTFMPMSYDDLLCCYDCQA